MIAKSSKSKLAMNFLVKMEAPADLDKVKQDVF